MKKIYIISLLFICFWANVTAQTVTINSLSKNMKGVRMNFQMDFSDALIMGMSENEFAKYEKDWCDDKPTIIRNFKTGTNLTLGRSLGIGEYKDARYIVKVKVNTITDEGFFICDVDILENDKVVFHLDHLTGGKEPSLAIGTKLARMKVWATLTGKSFGSILKNELSKE